MAGRKVPEFISKKGLSLSSQQTFSIFWIRCSIWNAFQPKDICIPARDSLRLSLPFMPSNRKLTPLGCIIPQRAFATDETRDLENRNATWLKACLHLMYNRLRVLLQRIEGKTWRTWTALEFIHFDVCYSCIVYHGDQGKIEIYTRHN